MRHFIRFTNDRLVKDLRSLNRSEHMQILVHCATKAVPDSTSRVFYGVTKIYADGHRHCESEGWFEVLVEIDDLAKSAPGYLRRIETTFVEELEAKLTSKRADFFKQRNAPTSPLPPGMRRRVEASL